jgi:tRNA dimethylallyltransferase
MANVFGNTLILTGPTGSGKSQLALELAEGLGAEIIAMDSMTLYRGMDIGTAKPGPEERGRVPHHLLDVLDPWESASVAWWLERAARCFQDIEARGRRALIVGGTPLYLKALLHGLFEGQPGDAALRGQLEEEARTFGPEALHLRLAQVDPVSASRLHANDVRRVVRALEVWELTGQPISALQSQWTNPVAEGNPNRCLCLDVSRAELYELINARVLEMIEAGLVKEVERLRGLPKPLSREASQAVGYKELFAYLDGQVTLDEAIARIQTRSRQLAKRQMTWFRSLSECQPVTSDLTFGRWGLTIKEGKK